MNRKRNRLNLICFNDRPFKYTSNEKKAIQDHFSKHIDKQKPFQSNRAETQNQFEQLFNFDSIPLDLSNDVNIYTGRLLASHFSLTFSINGQRSFTFPLDSTHDPFLH